jgi:NAD(P)-dependent dehydrogenase (short-subunit alcohol dehydrogenase family)
LNTGCLEEAKLQRMPKPKALSGRVALITGSAGGIGKAIAKKFAEEGAVVVLNDMNAERLAKVPAKSLKNYLVRMLTLPLIDVTKEQID